jgi:hypothetical protein
MSDKEKKSKKSNKKKGIFPKFLLNESDKAQQKEKEKEIEYEYLDEPFLNPPIVFSER